MGGKPSYVKEFEAREESLMPLFRKEFDRFLRLHCTLEQGQAASLRDLRLAFLLYILNDTHLREIYDSLVRVSTPFPGIYDLDVWNYHLIQLLPRLCDGDCRLKPIRVGMHTTDPMHFVLGVSVKSWPTVDGGQHPQSAKWVIH